MKKWIYVILGALLVFAVILLLKKPPEEVPRIPRLPQVAIVIDDFGGSVPAYGPAHTLGIAELGLVNRHEVRPGLLLRKFAPPFLVQDPPSRPATVIGFVDFGYLLPIGLRVQRPDVTN